MVEVTRRPRFEWSSGKMFPGQCGNIVGPDALAVLLPRSGEKARGDHLENKNNAADMSPQRTDQCQVTS